MSDFARLAARLLLALVFVPNGALKLADIDATAGYFEALSLPAPASLAWATGTFELVAGLLIATGVLVRPAAWALAGFCVAAGLIGHLGQEGDDPAVAFLHFQALLKDFGLAGGFVALSVAGAGRYRLPGLG